MRTGPKKLLDRIMDEKAEYTKVHRQVPNIILLGKSEYLEIRQLATVNDKGHVSTHDDMVDKMKIFMVEDKNELVVGVAEL